MTTFFKNRETISDRLIDTAKYAIAGAGIGFISETIAIALKQSDDVPPLAFALAGAVVCGASRLIGKDFGQRITGAFAGLALAQPVTLAVQRAGLSYAKMVMPASEPNTAIYNYNPISNDALELIFLGVAIGCGMGGYFGIKRLQSKQAQRPQTLTELKTEDVKPR